MKSSDGFTVLLQLFSIESFHYVDNGFYDKRLWSITMSWNTSFTTKGTFSFSFLPFPFCNRVLFLAILFPEKLFSYAVVVWGPLRNADEPKRRLRGTETLKNLQTNIEGGTCAIQHCRCHYVDNGFYDKCSL